MLVDPTIQKCVRVFALSRHLHLLICDQRSYNLYSNTRRPSPMHSLCHCYLITALDFVCRRTPIADQVPKVQLPILSIHPVHVSAANAQYRNFKATESYERV